MSWRIPKATAKITAMGLADTVPTAAQQRSRDPRTYHAPAPGLAHLHFTRIQGFFDCEVLQIKL